MGRPLMHRRPAFAGGFVFLTLFISASAQDLLEPIGINAENDVGGLPRKRYVRGGKCVQFMQLSIKEPAIKCVHDREEGELTNGTCGGIPPEKGRFIGPAPTVDGRYQGSSGEYRADACRLVTCDQAGLLAHYGGKRILLIGDSHIRNLFEV
eukprot:1177430-Prorocentrum_minimum.AAC.4